MKVYKKGNVSMLTYTFAIEITSGFWFQIAVPAHNLASPRVWFLFFIFKGFKSTIEIVGFFSSIMFCDMLPSLLGYFS